MEVTVPDLAGSLGGGGRYDNLLATFGRNVPACGFSLGLERIIVVMTERNMFPARVTQGCVHILIAWKKEDFQAEVLKLASELRAANLRVDVYPQADNFTKQFQYAETLKAKWILILGDDEVAKNVVKIRDPLTREERVVPRGIVADLLRAEGDRGDQDSKGRGIRMRATEP